MQVENRNRIRKRIVLTGGHAGSTAYAFVQALRRDNTYKWDVFWIGSKNAIEGSKLSTLEEKILPSLGVKTFTITAGRLQRRFTRYTIPSVLKIPVGFWQAFFLIGKIKPDVVLSFGGFASFPVVIMARYFRIPIIIHEQTSVYGRANKASQSFATKIALSRKESLKYFDKKKSVLIGNPVSDEILRVEPKVKIGVPATIFVTGGSRGSENINDAIEGILPKLLPKYRIIHQVGEANEAKYKIIKESMGKIAENYEIYGQLPPKNWGEVMRQADLIIGRSGANFVSELLVIKRPAILIPIPWTFGDEQTKNALSAQNFGIAAVLPQERLTPEALFQIIQKSFANWQKIVKKVKDKESPDIYAKVKLLNLLKETLQ